MGQKSVAIIMGHPVHTRHFSVCKYSESRGTQQMKYKAVAEAVLEKFCEARESFLPVRG